MGIAILKALLVIAMITDLIFEHVQFGNSILYDKTICYTIYVCFLLIRIFKKLKSVCDDNNISYGVDFFRSKTLPEADSKMQLPTHPPKV